ncbi:hypothetical protein CLM76_17660 [Vreelandella venusta]|nr:hypothetical protein CLM76_17660 [Halomonas hydrothermalis]
MMDKAIVDFIKSHVVDVAPNVFSNKMSSNLQGYVRAANDFKIEVSKITSRSFSFLYEGKEIGRLNSLCPSLVSAKAAYVCRSKSKTLSRLDAAGVQKKDYLLLEVGLDDGKIKKFWASSNFQRPMVVKPAVARGGNGVTVGIDNDTDFIAAWKKAKEVAPKNGKIVVEPYFCGLDVRVIVVGGKAVCSTVRLPSYVIGNGKDTVSELVKLKNNIRLSHPHHKKFPLLEESFKFRERVLAPGEILLLSRIANIHQGGEAVDNTHSVSRNVVQLAENSVRAIPGLGCAGVDMMINEHGDARVLEINTSSNFGIHYYPMYGENRNPAQAVLYEMMKKAVFPLSASFS